MCVCVCGTYYNVCQNVYHIVENFEFGLSSLIGKGYKSKAEITKDKVSYNNNDWM